MSCTLNQILRLERCIVGNLCCSEQDGGMQRVMRGLDRNVGKMFRALERHTLSIVILPGVIRYSLHSIHTGHADCTHTLYI